MAVTKGQSPFILLYHRTPFDEGKDEKGTEFGVIRKVKTESSQRLEIYFVREKMGHGLLGEK